MLYATYNVLSFSDLGTSLVSSQTQVCCPDGRCRRAHCDIIGSKLSSISQFDLSFSELQAMCAHMRTPREQPRLRTGLLGPRWAGQYAHLAHILFS